MERTCRCGKNTCEVCEMWWAARALTPLTTVLLDYDDDGVDRECQNCGYEIPDPYDEISQRPVTCSTCYADWGHQKWLREQKENLHNPESLGPPRCECDRLLHDCEVAICHRFPDYKPSVIAYRSKSGALSFRVPKQQKPTPGQLRLWGNDDRSERPRL